VVGGDRALNAGITVQVGHKEARTVRPHKGSKLLCRRPTRNQIERARALGTTLAKFQENPGKVVKKRLGGERRQTG